MRVRTVLFGLVCGTASVALAQDGGYVRFPSTSAQACAVACTSDQMCASWSFGTQARSYGQSQTRTDGGGLCTFSSSSVVRNNAGSVSGLPRRDLAASSVPMMSAPPQQNNENPPPSRSRQNNSVGDSPSGWDVRPAPWLNNTGQANAGQANAGSGNAGSDPIRSNGMPQMLRPVAPLPSVTPAAAPRIDFEPQEQRPAAVSRPLYQAPRQVTPVYAPPPLAAAPIFSAPSVPAPILSAPSRYPASRDSVPVAPNPMRAPSPVKIPSPIIIPVPPPGTQDMNGGENAPLISAPPPGPRPRAGAGAGVRAARPSVPNAAGARVVLPARAPQAAPSDSPSASPSASSSASPSAAAPPRQETAARPTSGRGAPRPPVRDPSNPESFRGADGMIDAAEMRRAQLNSAREQGLPAYSVQREWEAVAAERQRAEDAGEVRVDPLAGTSPVPPPPETRAQKRAREAEEAALEGEEARANSNEEGDDVAATPPPRRPVSRGARGVPRAKAPRQTSEAQARQQLATTPSNRRATSSRSAPAQALDREPKLSGGPG